MRAKPTSVTEEFQTESFCNNRVVGSIPFKLTRGRRHNRRRQAIRVKSYHLGLWRYRHAASKSNRKILAAGLAIGEKAGSLFQRRR
jgi:hypothetical protein